MKIDPGAAQWPYVQLAALLRERIQSGELGPRIPSQLELAEEAGVAPATVQRALKILKDEGLIHTVRGLGTFVTER